MHFFKKLLRFYYTVRPLRFEQIIYRLRYKLFPLKSISLNSRCSSVASWVWNGPEVLEPSFLGGNKVCFLNLTAEITSGNDWNSAAFEKLWLYNLHYFDDLNACSSLERVGPQLAFVERWIAENPPVRGNGWEPYPLSLRIVNWVKWYNRSGTNNQNIILSVHQQTHALSKQLEYHILGNHLFANGKALIFAGCFLQGDSADNYLSIGLKILEKEIPEQFLADGGHFELSPMYHCILLWDLLELIHLAGLSKHHRLIQVESNWRQVAQKALDWLNIMKHVDGEVSFFNDSAIGIAVSPSKIFDYGASLGLHAQLNETQPLQTLIQSGYSKISFDEHSLIFDHAQVGPDYLPGHAHADTLSFEWSVSTQRVFVNSGTSLYGVSAERLRQRKTAAHNTIEVDGEDSSEVWSGFRVARRAKAKLESAIVENESVTISASHDGYFRLKGKVTHRRSIQMFPEQLIIRDQLTGRFKQAVAHFHLHPSVQASISMGGIILLMLPCGKKLEFRSSAECKLVQSSWHPHFGQSLVSTKIEVTLVEPELQTVITLLKE